MRRSGLVICMVFTAAYSCYAALYDFERQKEINIMLGSLISLQNQVIREALPLGVTVSDLHKIEPMDDNINEQKNHQSVVQLVDNLFILNMYDKMVEYMRGSFYEKGMGDPYLSAINLVNPTKYYVLKAQPTNDNDFNPRNPGNLVTNILEFRHGIKHFDQQFQTFIYRIDSPSGLMVVRGNYVIVDFNCNGIPDKVFFIRKYRDELRKFLPYLLLVGEGEDRLAGSSYHARYIDSFYLMLEYIINNFPIEVPDSAGQRLEASLLY